MVNEKVWTNLHTVYGGGPQIARGQEDIYAAPDEQEAEESVYLKNESSLMNQMIDLKQSTFKDK